MGCIKVTKLKEREREKKNASAATILFEILK